VCVTTRVANGVSFTPPYEILQNKLVILGRYQRCGALPGMGICANSGIFGEGAPDWTTSPFWSSCAGANGSMHNLDDDSIAVARLRFFFRTAVHFSDRKC